MAVTRFDPSHSVKFDLGRGSVHLEGTGARVLVPADALVELCRHAGADSLTDFGRKLGTEVGLRVTAHWGEGGLNIGVEGFVEHLGGNLALLGLGSLSLERWGKALVFVVEGSPLGSAGDPLLAAVIEGALQRSLGRDTRAVILGRDDGHVRFLVIGAPGADRVRAWLAEGKSWGEAIARLHEGSAA
ncbi:MAG: hypothetical protein IT377_15290 [Polyangiaceae bacterium]|nr:hypothetical protein [Polyangiaceae bacterium]